HVREVHRRRQWYSRPWKRSVKGSERPLCELRTEPVDLRRAAALCHLGALQPAIWQGPQVREPRSGRRADRGVAARFDLDDLERLSAEPATPISATRIPV